MSSFSASRNRVEHRTVGNFGARTPQCRRSEDGLDPPEIRNLGPHLCKVTLRPLLDLRAGRRGAIFEPHQPANVLHREPEFAGAQDEAKARGVRGGIDAVAGCRVALNWVLPHFVWRNYPETGKFRRYSCEFEEALVARERCCRSKR